MFIREKVKTLAALGSATAGLWMLATVSSLGSAEQCRSQSEPDVTADRLVGIQKCQPGMQISWKAWVSGKSLSFQFHFFDLLELLYGGESDGRFSGKSN